MVQPNSVLAVVDMQNGFVSRRSAHIVPPVRGLVDRWAASGRPYVMTRFLNHSGSPYERLIGWNRMQESPETDIVDSLRGHASQATAVLDKSVYSMFTDEGSALVERHGWTNIVICGIATESCVLKTAADAFELGLTPWVVTDAVYSHAGVEAHEAGLLVAKRFIGRRQLVTTDEVLSNQVTATA